MLALLRRMSARDYVSAPMRLGLMVGGIASGIALIAALGIINRSVLANFRAMLERAAGKAELEVTLGTGEIGFAESVAETVRADHAVAAAVPLVRGTLGLPDSPGETLQLFGADLIAEEDLTRYPITLATERRRVLEAMADPRSILLTDAFARRRGACRSSAFRGCSPLRVWRSSLEDSSQ